MHNQKKDNSLSKNKNQPEVPENQTVWKSNNPGVKEETFIQTGRRGGDGWQVGGWQTVWSHIQVQIKTGRNNWRVSNPSPGQTVQPRVPAQVKAS